jgi:hypothetical protein
MRKESEEKKETTFYQVDFCGNTRITKFFHISIPILGSKTTNSFFLGSGCQIVGHSGYVQQCNLTLFIFTLY